MILAIRSGKLVTAGGRAHGRHQRGVMNKTEAAFAAHLELQKKVGEIESWEFEPRSLVMAKGYKYTPDFIVRMKSKFVLVGETICYEVKAVSKVAVRKQTKVRMTEAARVRIGWAAQRFPEYKFVIVWPKGDGWTERVVAVGEGRG